MKHLHLTDMSQHLPPGTDALNTAMIETAGRMLGTSAVSQVFNLHELLGTVFIFCLEDEGKDNFDNSGMWTLIVDASCQYPRPSEHEAPLLLAHVCRHWRTVALNNPRLWSRLQLEFSMQLCKDVPRMEGQLSALQFWLALSRSIPISVRLRLGQRNEGFYGSYYQMFLSMIPSKSRLILTKIAETLFEHTHRWENIDILLLEFGLRPFFKNMNQEYPHLLSLKLDNRFSPMKKASDGKDLSLNSAPNLKELVLVGRNFGHPKTDVFAPTAFPSSLHSLELNFASMVITQSMHGSHLKKLALKNVVLTERVLAMFPTAFPILETLVIVYDYDQEADTDVEIEEDENDISSWDFIVLDHLTMFKLSASVGHQVPLPLILITAPALIHLALSVHTTSSNLQRDIIRFLRRSQAPVKHFFCEGVGLYDDAGYLIDEGSDNDDGDLGEDDIRLFLEEMPGLVELNMHQPALSSVLSFLGDPTHLPELTKIYNEGDLLINENESDGSTDALSDPRVQDILNIIDRRCRKRHELDADGRVWLKMLALPVYEEQDRLIRETEIFRQADVEFENTYEWQDGSIGGEDINDYL